MEIVVKDKESLSLQLEQAHTLGAVLDILRHDKQGQFQRATAGTGKEDDLIPSRAAAEFFKDLGARTNTAAIKPGQVAINLIIESGELVGLFAEEGRRRMDISRTVTRDFVSGASSKEGSEAVGLDKVSSIAAAVTGINREDLRSRYEDHITKLGGQVDPDKIKKTRPSELLLDITAAYINRPS